MLRSDIWRRTATGGIRAMVAGKRVTSAFMSLRSSSSCFRTARKRVLCSEGKRGEGTVILNTYPTLGLTRCFTFVQHSIGWFIPSHRLLGQVLMAFSQAFHLCETGVQSHRRVRWVFGHVQIGSSPQLLLNHQGLLQELKGGAAVRINGLSAAA